MTQIAFLHLTDLHMGLGGLTQVWPRILQDLKEDLRFVIGQTKVLDLVLFTGDLTQSGQRGEFGQVNVLLERLWELFRELKQEPRFLAVPGNHDLTWPDKKDPVALALTELWQHEHVNGEFWRDSGSIYRGLIEDCFSNYREWWKHLPVPTVEGLRSGALPGDFSATLTKEAVQLGLLGLNTAFLQLKGGVQPGALSLGLQQFHQACNENGPAWSRRHDTCLLMTHHPAEWLRQDARNVLEGEIHSPSEFALHLCGHMHEPDLRSLSLGGGPERRRLQGAALFSNEPWGHPPKSLRLCGYSVGRLTFMKHQATLEVWPRKATPTPHGGWRLQLDQEGFSIRPGSQSTVPQSLRLTKRSTTAAPKPPPDNGVERALPAKYAALVGPKSFSEVHDLLARLLTSPDRPTPVHVKNVALDMERTWAMIRDEIMSRPWSNRLVWQSLMADGQATSIQTAHSPSSILSPAMARLRESQMLDYRRDNSASIERNNLDFSCRGYSDTPLMHGFLVDDRFLFVGFASYDGTRWDSSPYLNFDRDPKHRDQLDGGVASHFIQVFKNWFNAQWQGANARPIWPGIGDGQ